MNHLIKLNQQKVEAREKELSSIIAARNNETKSSAGDKFETSRAMLQQEQDKLESNLFQLRLDGKQLQRIKSTNTENKVTFGSLVITNQGKYLISIGLGKLIFNEELYFIISPKSPIGIALMGMEEQDMVAFNAKQIIVQTVL